MYTKQLIEKEIKELDNKLELTHMARVETEKELWELEKEEEQIEDMIEELNESLYRL